MQAATQRPDLCPTSSRQQPPTRRQLPCTSQRSGGGSRLPPLLSPLRHNSRVEDDCAGALDQFSACQLSPHASPATPASPASGRAYWPPPPPLPRGLPPPAFTALEYLHGLGVGDLSTAGAAAAGQPGTAGVAAAAHAAPLQRAHSLGAAIPLAAHARAVLQLTPAGDGGGGAVQPPPLLRLPRTPTRHVPPPTPRGEPPRTPRGLSMVAIDGIHWDLVDEASDYGPPSPPMPTSPQAGDGLDALPRSRSGAAPPRDQDLRRAALINRSLGGGALRAPSPSSPHTEAAAAAAQPAAARAAGSSASNPGSPMGGVQQPVLPRGAPPPLVVAARPPTPGGHPALNSPSSPSMQRFSRAQSPLSPQRVLLPAAGGSGALSSGAASPEGGTRGRLRALRESWPALTGGGGAVGGLHVGAYADGADEMHEPRNPYMAHALSPVALRPGSGAGSARSGSSSVNSSQEALAHSFVYMLPHRMRDAANMALQEGWSSTGSGGSLRLAGAPAGDAPAAPLQQLAMQQHLGAGARMTAYTSGVAMYSLQPGAGAGPAGGDAGAQGEQAAAAAGACSGSSAGGELAAGVAAASAPSAQQVVAGRPPLSQVRRLVADAAFVQQLLAGLPGVDSGAPGVARVLRALQGAEWPPPAP